MKVNPRRRQQSGKDQECEFAVEITSFPIPSNLYIHVRISPPWPILPLKHRYLYFELTIREVTRPHHNQS